MPDKEIEKSYEHLKQLIKEHYDSEDVLRSVEEAYEIASKAHEGQKRLSGQPYIIHPLAVAEILVNLGMDRQSIIAALLHDTVEDTPMTLDDVRQKFGADVAGLVDGVTKLGKVPFSSREEKEERQAENIRKMLLAMSQDIRVIIIKLADRLHNMRTLAFQKPQKRRDIALETLEIYAPIAHRLGIRSIKVELEDLAISFLDPVAYHEIGDKLEEQSTSRNEFLQSIEAKISERVREEVADAHIEGRIKSVHGIYRKMYMQNKTFDEIYDIYAVRIIVNSVIDCYNCLGIIHDMYKPLPGRFKDYISTPKPNMYQSLHTTVIGSEGIPFEVQIRTWEMHRTAEYGIAAHWKYKLGMTNDKMGDRLAWIRQLLDTQKDSENVEDIVLTIKTDLVPEEVFVFTPKGDVINLPQGATVIDFAYAIHSAVGNRMQGAKVDGRIVPIDYKVKTGEIVDVITSSNPNKGPSRDWLKIVKTSEARSKIRSWFKKERREENIVEGKAEVEREFRRSFIRLDDDELEKFLQTIAERQHFNSVDDFYAAIGYGGISLTRLMPRIRDDYNKLLKTSDQDEIQQAYVPQKKKTKSNEGVVVEGLDNCLIKFSRCCNPLPGDEIIGFITRGHGVSIHKRDCTNVPKTTALAPEPERWIHAYWDKNVREEFKSTLLISCFNRVGLLADISGQFANMHVMIHDISTRNFKDGRVALTVTITVNSIEHLKSVVSKIERIDGVLSVERSGV
ncbi:MAG: bifunctional (p)ppGpp synthetase/guanosine-3',5'-bis(diphosphate) 3'-pyrophosphohydrolase [Clostridiales bacterium]|nr:bifunctional (p)ppGpp synthetase/guanosine-3',5'-bis(diphosphate) 3'-pyrophosphohydrolase [Clostridiales bacterium]